LPSVSRTEEVANVLRDEILGGQYRTGERLPSERDLAERFGVNRGIARIALKKLEQLGIADIQAGGARVAPLDHASLEVVGHLLDLRDPPDPDLVAQVLEAYRGVSAAALRCGVERASAEEMARALEIVRTVVAGRVDVEAQNDLEIEFSKLFIDASRNLVLKLVRRGISVNFLKRLDLHHARPPRTALKPLMQRLHRALEERDSAAAAESFYAGMELTHERIVAAVRERLEQTRASSGR
jgi:DNA-binding FadR family transcriptional regulator